jgi:hypothetical protein
MIDDVVDRFSKANLSLEIISGGGTGEEWESKEMIITNAQIFKIENSLKHLSLRRLLI